MSGLPSFHRQFTPARSSAQRGTALIEVLISVFVLAVGIIGSAGMQLVALRTAQDSTFHTNALWLAGDMSERILANLRTADPGDPENPYRMIDLPASDAMQSDGGDCYLNECSMEHLAHADLEQWATRLAAMLPGARARICADTGTETVSADGPGWPCSTDASGESRPARFLIKIGWKQKADAAASSERDMPQLVFQVPVANP